MTPEQKEKYLSEHGWRKLTDKLWTHDSYKFTCGTDVAVELQEMRNKNET